MNKKTFITMMLALVATAGTSNTFDFRIDDEDVTIAVNKDVAGNDIPDKETAVGIMTDRIFAVEANSGHVGINNNRVLHASMWFGNKVGGYTDVSGMIEIPQGTKQIRLSHICYETKNIAKVTPDLQTIFLVPKSINLDEVAISAKAPKRTKTTEVGLMKAKTQTKHKGANGFEMALCLTSILYWQVSIIPPIGWYSRKSRHPSMPLSALIFDSQMSRLVPQKTSPSLMVASYSLQVRNSAKTVSALPVQYCSPRQAYSLWWNG